jgi:hypothetical protein
LFDELATYTVTVNAAVSISGFDFQAGSVTFAAPAANTFSLGNVSISGGTANFSGALNASTSNLAITSGAILNLSNSTTTFNGMTLISGGRVNRISGSFIPGSSHQLAIQGGGTFSNSGSLDFGGGTIGITSGQLSASQLNLGNALVSAGTCALTVDGASSRVQVGGGATSLWGSSGGDASITFRNSATGSVGDVTLGTAAGSLVNLNIESGASLSLGNTLVGNGGSATITLSGGSLTLAGTSALTLASGGILNLNGGTFTSSTGSIQVGAGGRISSAGAFLANGDVAINGGSLSSGGTFILAAGRTLSIAGSGSAIFNSITSFSGSGVSVGAGALIATNLLQFGNSGSGSLSVSGGTLSAGSVSFGSAGGTGTFTLVGGGVAHANRQRRIPHRRHPQHRHDQRQQRHGYRRWRRLPPELQPRHRGQRRPARQRAASTERRHDVDHRRIRVDGQPHRPGRAQRRHRQCVE